MTQEEIIELACQTFGGIIKKEERKNFLAFAKLVRNHYSYTHAHLWLTRIEGAVKAEREVCAKICDSFQARDVGMQPAECAGAIRARGQA